MKINVKPKSQKQKDADVALIESNYGSLEELKHAKYIISKVKYQEQEQSQLKPKRETLHKNIEVQERQTENLEKFIQLASKYADRVPLTPYVLREVVKNFSRRQIMWQMQTEHRNRI